MSLKDWAGRMPYIVSFIVFCIGSLLLLGWFLNLTPLKASLWDITTLKASTALCFVLAGSTLALICRNVQQQDLNQNTTHQHANLLIRFAALSGAVSILLISLWALVESGLSWNFGMAQLTFSGQAGLATSPSRHMEVGTAIKFTLVGTALLLFTQRHQNFIKIAQSLTLATVIMTIQAMVSHHFDRGILAPSGLHLTTTLPTTLTFLLLCTGMLFLYPKQGFMQPLMTQSDGGVIARKLLPTAILLPPILGWCLVWGYRAGYYEPEFAVSLLVISFVAIQTLVIGQSVNWLNRNDARRHHLETLRQQTEANLRESETCFRQLAKSSDDVFWISDAQTQQIVYISPQYENIWGRSLENLKRSWTEWLEAIHIDDRERVQKSFFPSVLQQQYDEEYRIVRPDGSIRWIRDRGYPVYDAMGTVQYVSGIAEDITERKRLESDHDSFSAYRSIYFVLRAWMATLSSLILLLSEFWATAKPNY